MSDCPCFRLYHVLADYDVFLMHLYVYITQDVNEVSIYPNPRNWERLCATK